MKKAQSDWVPVREENGTRWYHKNYGDLLGVIRERYLSGFEDPAECHINIYNGPEDNMNRLFESGISGSDPALVLELKPSVTSLYSTKSTNGARPL